MALLVHPTTQHDTTIVLFANQHGRQDAPPPIDYFRATALLVLHSYVTTAAIKILGLQSIDAWLSDIPEMYGLKMTTDGN